MSSRDVSDETRQKRSVSLRKYHDVHPEAHQGENNPNYGKNHKGLGKGRKFSEEWKKNIGDAERGYRWYTNGERNIKINEGDSIPEVFYIGLTSSSVQGKQWFNNGVEQCLAEECPEGWTKGMLSSNNHLDKKWYNNGKINKLFFEGEEDDGFVLGMLSSNNNGKTKNTKWYNDGNISIRCFPGTEPEGFVNGRIKRQKIMEEE